MGGGIGGNFGNTNGSAKKSNSIKNNHLYGEPGQINKNGYKETYIGKDGRAYKEIHHTDHGNPKNHTNPHEHTIHWGKDGKPTFNRSK